MALSGPLYGYPLPPGSGFSACVVPCLSISWFSCCLPVIPLPSHPYGSVFLRRCLGNIPPGSVIIITLPGLSRRRCLWNVQLQTPPSLPCYVCHLRFLVRPPGLPRIPCGLITLQCVRVYVVVAPLYYPLYLPRCATSAVP